mmetsp:Transcript_9398/g.34877  ORF Transcript_9398/g.34877 Transcript_9398/m.34877 type:complete len:278 (+) Transcript_9398:2140-2973(+)
MLIQFGQGALHCSWHMLVVHQGAHLFDIFVPIKESSVVVELSLLLPTQCPQRGRCISFPHTDSMIITSAQNIQSIMRESASVYTPHALCVVRVTRYVVGVIYIEYPDEPVIASSDKFMSCRRVVHRHNRICVSGVHNAWSVANISNVKCVGIPVVVGNGESERIVWIEGDIIGAHLHLESLCNTRGTCIVYGDGAIPRCHRQQMLLNWRVFHLENRIQLVDIKCLFRNTSLGIPKFHTITCSGKSTYLSVVLFRCQSNIQQIGVIFRNGVHHWFLAQ